MILDLLGVSRQNQMIIREYMPSILFMGGAFLLQSWGEGFYNNHPPDNAYLSPLFIAANQQIGLWILWGSVAMLALGVLRLFYSTYRLLKWEKGEILECCDFCSGLVKEKYGRYGAYHKCLACGATHSIR